MQPGYKPPDECLEWLQKEVYTMTHSHSRFCFLLFLPALLLAGFHRAQATPAGLILPDTCRFTGLLAVEEERHGPLRQEKGEIIAAEKDYLIIRRDGGEECFYPVNDCLVFVNGRPGENAALKPVAPGCYFYACLYFLPDGKLHLVAGWYLGGEVKILKIEEADGGRSLVTVRGLENPGETTVVWYYPEDGAGLFPGMTGYLLLASDGRVRTFFPLE